VAKGGEEEVQWSAAELIAKSSDVVIEREVIFSVVFDFLRVPPLNAKMEILTAAAAPLCVTKGLARLAAMARLKLPEDPAELARLQSDIQGIVGCLESLGQVDTEGVAPLVSPSWDGRALQMQEDDSHSEEGSGFHFRGDDVTEGSAEERERLLQQAPQTQHGFFVLPNVIKSDPGE